MLFRSEKYGVEVPYDRCYHGKEIALDKLYGKYGDSFQLLYSFKAEVERASPGSIVEIDKHKVEYKINNKKLYKECFRRVSMCFKACQKGILEGCRAYLAVDATSLTGRFRGHEIGRCC